MTRTLRGADIVAQTLKALGIDRAFTLSGNHIMSLFDAALDTGLELIHTRHEAAAVHMADAWGRLSGTPGVAMVTGGPGHANAAGALYTALANESPLVLLSGHAATHEIGRGGFQEMAQAELARVVAKAAWTARSAATLSEDVAEAIRIATSGRPGPVNLNLPSDLLDAVVPADAVRIADLNAAPIARQSLAPPIAAAVIADVRAAKAPLVIAAPHLSGPHGRPLLARLENALGAPVVVMESPRGIHDAALGAYGRLLKNVDLVVLIGKPLDFTVKWLQPPVVGADCQVIMIEPDPAILHRARREIADRLTLAALADARAAIEALLEAAARRGPRPGRWLSEARAQLDGRPAAWEGLRGVKGRVHPAELFRALRPLVLGDPDTVFICDGGEFAQWGQSLIAPPRRIINGVAGSIGAGIPFALAARCFERKAPVISVVGDGTFGFHMAEIDTAVRHNLPFVVIVGNDARWNAESEIQRRAYGPQRMHSCELLPTRYDEVAKALGAHGEYVEDACVLVAAFERAIRSGKPACVNVMIMPTAAPMIP